MRLPAHLSTGRGVRPYFRSLWWSPEIAFFPWDCRREGALDGEGRHSLSPAPLRLQSAPWFMGQNLPRCLCVREAKIHTETGGYGEMLLTVARCIGCIRMKMVNLSVCVCGCSWNETWETLCYGWLLFTIPAIIRVIEPLWNMTERNSWIFLTQRRSLSPTSHTGGLRMGPGLRMRPSTTRWCPKWRSPCSPAPSTLQQDNTIIPR